MGNPRGTPIGLLRLASSSRRFRGHPEKAAALWSRKSSGRARTSNWLHPARESAGAPRSRGSARDSEAFIRHCVPHPRKRSWPPLRAFAAALRRRGVGRTRHHLVRFASVSVCHDGRLRPIHRCLRMTGLLVIAIHHSHAQCMAGTMGAGHSLLRIFACSVFPCAPSQMR